MELDEKTLILIDENGNEQKMEILFTFEDDSFGHKYVLYTDPTDDSGQVFVSSYTDEGELHDITDEKEWDMVEEVFNSFMAQYGENEE